MTETLERDRIGYRAAHLRLASTRGLATNYACVDCGGEGAEWSYDHSAGDAELIADDLANMGAPYSLDPADYSPRCKPCHVRLDRSHARVRRGESGTDGRQRRFTLELDWDDRIALRQAEGLPDDPLDDVRELLGHFIAAQDPSDLDVVALWIAGTHLAAHGVGRAFPRLAIVAPTWGAGKSTLLEIIARLSHKGEVIGSTVTDALIPRILQTAPGTTLCFDEADKTLNPENKAATAILNAGWERNGTARLNQPDGQGWRPEKISVFAPVALAGNGVRLQPDTQDRTLTVRLIRSDETPEVDWNGDLEGVDARLLERLSFWAADVADFRHVRKPPTGNLRGRDRDRWSILLSVAHASGGHWVEVAHSLADSDALARRLDAMNEDTNPNEQLVYDLLAVWPLDATWVGTVTLCDRLAAYRPSLWGAPSGRLLSPKSLAGKLKRFYGLPAPERLGTGSDRERGYTRSVMERAWRVAGLSTAGADTEAEQE